MIIYRFIKYIFPLVDQELSFWKRYALNIPDPILSQQATMSIEKKSFHAQGGSIYSLYPNRKSSLSLKFIVALQTISDYLDNLCDRVGVMDADSFLQLHQALSDALDPSPHFSDYYANYPYKNDADYLYSLVNTCKKYIRTLPSYEKIRKEVLFLAKLYGEMQSYKHIQETDREDAIRSWFRSYSSLYPDLSPWEFSAAAGSTLGIFLLCVLAEDENLTKDEVLKTVDAYFPWVCGFHILLDYFIDEQEDRITGDLNFVSYYNSQEEKKQRLAYFLRQSIDKVSGLPHPLFHQTILHGLLAMYLSDPKTNAEKEKSIRKYLLRKAPCNANILYGICKILRKKKTIA
ncbi:MAG TPA: tetraprenyl-beta-curcumene synthase family protein [Clostridiales bacterium]|nr:tetraprenyl-beta-curcumene synthase family protein [Clostridiales bacterium]